MSGIKSVLEIVLLGSLEIDLWFMQTPKWNEQTRCLNLSFAGKWEGGWTQSTRMCWTAWFFLNLEGRWERGVLRASFLEDTLPPKRNCTLPLSSFHEPGHLKVRVTTLSSCSMSWSTFQHGISKQQHSQAALRLLSWGWWSILSALVYNHCFTCLSEEHLSPS